MKFQGNKLKYMNNLSDEDGIIAALAIDQRGSIKKMLGKTKDAVDEEDIIEFKKMVSSILTKYSSSILLDPEYGIPASRLRDENSGLILAYEKTGYDTTKLGRLPDLLDEWSARRLVENGAEAIKILLYYDVDEDISINDEKHAFVESVGDECMSLEVPYFLEIITYDSKIDNSKDRKYAKLKPYKVNKAVEIFSDIRYNVDVLKVEVPVNMNYVEGYSDDFVYSKEEAMYYFKEQSDVSRVPFIFLSAGVSQKLFQETLHFAKESGSRFNGVLCGRATWAGSVDEYVKSPELAEKWLKTIGKDNITSLNQTLKETATPWSRFY